MQNRKNEHDTLAEEIKSKSKLASGFVRKKTLQTTLQEVSQQMYARNKELADINRTLSLLRTIDSLVLQPNTSLKLICQQITDAIINATGYPFVGLFTRPSGRRTHIELYGVSGSWQGNAVPISFERPPQIQSGSDWLETSNVSNAVDVKGHSPQMIADMLSCSPHEIKALSEQLPLKSVYTVKLVVRERIVGLLVVGFLSLAEDITESDIHLLDRLGGSIGVALDSKLLFEENQHIVLQLQKTNEKLKILDETKDEFISMASHQLRTPLTSVKGYLSMVLEGDAGKVSDQQQKLLGQAFTSSQKMVYLIADLLNLSRLRTGKFVLDLAPTNLANVITGEVEQLTEAAAVRNLKLTYKPPAKFPTLMMDETKIRQVLMNFIDNAIYYTPSGGNISIGLKETPQSIEFTVKDDGIGVPVREQHHLFNKFYRAGNARKARPDGTGLGLFMAKKVIIASGGALIFKSAEGKGSTFGFTFSKKKLAPPITEKVSSTKTVQDVK